MSAAADTGGVPDIRRTEYLLISDAMSYPVVISCSGVSRILDDVKRNRPEKETITLQVIINGHECFRIYLQ